jgi:hypothetical protein
VAREVPRSRTEPEDPVNGPRYLAVPVQTREGRAAGWRVYRLPVGNGTPAAGSFRGPFAGQRARLRARKLSRGAAR